MGSKRTSRSVAFFVGLMTIAALTATSQASAATLIGQESSGDVYLIDTDALTVTLLGNAGGNGPDIQLTPDGSTLLIATTGSQLLSVSPDTGTQTGLVAVTYPTGLPSPNNSLDTSTALEYVGGTLYAAFDRAGPETQPGYLGTIDPVTGATTAIGELTGMNAPAGGFAYYNGVMYATSSANSVFSELYRINLTTGAATFIANITFAGNQVEAATALEIIDGVAYTKMNDTTGGVDEETLYAVDLSTGELSTVFDMGVRMISLTRAQAVQASAIPTLGTWGLVALIIGLGLVAVRGAARHGV